MEYKPYNEQNDTNSLSGNINHTTSKMIQIPKWEYKSYNKHNDTNSPNGIINHVKAQKANLRKRPKKPIKSKGLKLIHRIIGPLKK